MPTLSQLWTGRPHRRQQGLLPLASLVNAPGKPSFHQEAEEAFLCLNHVSGPLKKTCRAVTSICRVRWQVCLCATPR